MPDSRIPLYLITGFLDSGKTTLLIDTLGMDYFNDGERTVLLPMPATARLAFAHSDWSGYSVLEEAFTRGHHAGLWASHSS